jgi:heptaprenylglyceryl phosphate synthase
MTRTALVIIALLSTLATPFVVNATAAPAAVLTVSTAIPVTASQAAALAASPETCRQVRVVYPGYGLSAAATTCAAPQAQR